MSFFVGSGGVGGVYWAGRSNDNSSSFSSCENMDFMKAPELCFFISGIRRPLSWPAIQYLFTKNRTKTLRILNWFSLIRTVRTKMKKWLKINLGISLSQQGNKVHELHFTENFSNVFFMLIILYFIQGGGK